ncbi:MAG: TssQ family T6SS-associated lipoprotein [Burkholderiaceae bacterium]
MAIISKSIRLSFAGMLLVLLAACATQPTQPPQVGLSDLLNQPGEKALLNGIHLYEDAQYADAEKSFSSSLEKGFVVKKDAALAYKYLAFIYCTSSRIDACKKSFRAARASDPSFMLNKSESGHPQWGPVYRQVIAE